MSPEPKLSKVEHAKRDSRGLRGSLAETLAADASSFSGEDPTLLKFHGIYEQHDRDAKEKIEDRRYNYMVRLAIPGGALTADQYLAIDRLAGEHGGGSLRLTTRQGIQFHGLLLGDLKPTLQALHRALLTTLAACGDVRRNVMACPAPLADPAHRTVQRAAAEIARDLEPKSRAYAEIWLDGERLALADEIEEPFYGPTYLPRKFKVGIALEGDNCIDVHAYDAGLVGLRGPDGEVAGWNLLAGGGLGITHGKSDTFARLASPIGFVPVELGVAAIRAVAALYRDHGNRGDRKHARLKYIVEAWGVERFRAALAQELGHPIAPPRPLASPREEDHLGVHEQGDGRAFLGVFIENGRVQGRARAGLAEAVSRFRPGVRLTAMQSLLLTDLDPAGLPHLQALLAGHGIAPVEQLSTARRWSMACPALPTCSLALTDAERALPAAIADLEAEFELLGIDDVPLTVRMTGCPNGCARPYNADLAFVGRKPGAYHVYVGGGLGGDRLADLFAAEVPPDSFVAVLRPLLERYRDERRPGEPLGDFWQRLAGHPPRHLLTGKEEALGERVLGLVEATP
jgi:sulfite reductase beta subunit-like hemoprotein